MKEKTAQRVATTAIYLLAVSALLVIIVMSLNDYSAERRKLEKVRRELYSAQCDQLANAYECNTYGRAGALSK